MRVIVCAKQVPDLVQIRMDRNTRQPVLKEVPFIIGDIEKNVLEEAAKIKEQRQVEVVAVSAGWPPPETAVLECLGRGADRAVMVADPLLETLNSTAVARVLAGAIRKIGNYDLVLLGEGSTDDNYNQTGAMLAQLLGISLVSYVRKLDIADKKARAVSSYEDCLETVEVSLPAAITLTAEINIPRIPSIIEVMEASSKPQQSWSLADIGITGAELKECGSVRLISNLYPEQTRKNIILAGEMGPAIDSLFQSLHKEGVLEK